MGDITLLEIRRLFERQGLGEEFREQEPLLLWPQVVGEQMSKLTQPLRVRQGILYVEAASHVIAQQLSLLKDTYLRKLNELLGEERLVDLRFRVGEMRPPTREPAEGEQLSLLDREELARWLEGIDDPHLRETLERFVLAALKRDRARAARGWSRCRRCGVHHEGEGEICYYCELEDQSP